jgi:hypothetical protein
MKTPISIRIVSLAAVLSATALAFVARADVPISDEARMHFQAGVNLLKDPDGARYEDAYREFKAAHAAAASYKILGNLGLCAMKLERDGEAIDAYGKYLEHVADIDPAEAKQVQTDWQTLKAGVVKVKLTIEPAGTTIADARIPVRGERVQNQYGPFQGTAELGLRSGHHVITVRADGYQDATWDFEAPAGSSQTNQIVLSRTSAATPQAAIPAASTTTFERPIPVGVYVGLATTGAFAIGGSIVGVLASGKRSDFNGKNDGLHVDEAQSLHDTGKTYNLVADVLFGGAVVAAGVTTYLYLARPEAKTGAIGAGVVAAKGTGAVVVTGRF